MLEQIGRYEAQHDLTYVHRIFLKLANPAYVIEQLGKLWTRFHDTGYWEVTRFTTTHATGIDLVLECAVGGVFLFLVSVAGIYLLAGLLSRPVERLTETIKAIAAGDFTRQAPEDGAREHVQLARCFNQLNQADQSVLATGSGLAGSR